MSAEILRRRLSTAKQALTELNLGSPTIIDCINVTRMLQTEEHRRAPEQAPQRDETATLRQALEAAIRRRDERMARVAELEAELSSVRGQLEVSLSERRNLQNTIASQARTNQELSAQWKRVQAELNLSSLTPAEHVLSTVRNLMREHAQALRTPKAQEDVPPRASPLSVYSVEDLLGDW